MVLPKDDEWMADVYENPHLYYWVKAHETRNGKYVRGHWARKPEKREY